MVMVKVMVKVMVIMAPTPRRRRKKSNKGDCICIAKKIALIDEFNALRDGGCTKPNHEPHLFF